MTDDEALSAKADMDRQDFFVTEDARAAADKVQSFFEGLAAEMRKPHFGDHMREWTRALLLRAEEANLYNPKANT